MKKYAKIIDEKSKEVSVALGTNPPCDYEEMEVEQAYTDKWYLKGFCPETPQSFINSKRIEELKGFLAAADYWGQKYIDGEYTSEEWEEKKAQRKAWREEIRSLENCVYSDG